MAPKEVVLKGIRTALVVGSILTLINQWQAIFGDEAMRWPAFFLTYLVPYTVFVYSYHTNKRQHVRPTGADKPEDRAR